MENLKVQHYKQYKRFTTFQKNVTNTTIRTKDCWHSAMRQRKERFVDKFSCVKERRNSRQSVMSKILTKCHASNTKFYKYIYIYIYNIYI